MSSERRPFNTSSDIELPPGPVNVCTRCWKGVVAAHFGLWSDPVEKALDNIDGPRWTGGYEYSITEAEWNACRNSLCRWGKFIQREVFDLYARLRGFEQYQQFEDFGPPWHYRIGTPSPLTSGKASSIIIVVNDYPEITLGVFAHLDDPAAAWIEGRTRNPFIGRPDVLATARSFVDNCVQNHERCRVSSSISESASLPTRLIDCSDLQYPRIVVTDGWDKHVPYVALSYVWGGEQPHRTTEANLPSYMNGIDLSLLPQTILDAIHVTRTALGVQYLWIDSLCIIQDSREDKQRELAKMRDVYLHAFLTLDAANAQSVSQGILHDGEPLGSSTAIPFVCPPRFGQHELLVGSIYISSPLGYDHNINPWSSDALRSSQYIFTGKRAWCLQEALLSGRRLLFTTLDLQFRCRSSTEHVGGPRGRPFIGYQDVTPPEPILIHPVSTPLPGSDDWANIHFVWQNIVEDYMRRFLSYPSDRLVACAGLAELFGRTLRSEYLAGLWKDSLLYDLLWYTRGEGNVQCGDDRAPSWSWAASAGGGPVRYERYKAPLGTVSYVQLAEVGECAVVLEDPVLRFGPATAGFLMLHAPLIGPYRKRTPFNSSGFPTRVVLERTVGQRGDESGKQYDHEHTDVAVADQTPFLDTFRVIVPYMDRAYAPEEELGGVWLVPLVYHNPRREDTMSSLQCLVVAEARAGTGPDCTPDEREGPRVFKRVGYHCAYERSDYQFVGELHHKIDGQWTFPRTEIKLV
ncbi:heterokaryon incompatibility protein-domain-containing protein [Cubamyces lactineus]|nr:heterokaryon incompatibility protein-domain-containing protein [Cubamyces lactineus]